MSRSCLCYDKMLYSCREEPSIHAPSQVLMVGPGGWQAVPMSSFLLEEYVLALLSTGFGEGRFVHSHSS